MLEFWITKPSVTLDYKAMAMHSSAIGSKVAPATLLRAPVTPAFSDGDA
jgi:hypothetical protein